MAPWRLNKDFRRITFDNIDIDRLCEIHRDLVSRINGLIMKDKKFRADIGKQLFANRMTEDWIKLFATFLGAENSRLTQED